MSSYHNINVTPRVYDRAGRSGALPDERIYVARLALDPPTRRHAYRLRYESYLASGHIDPNASGLFSDEYDLLPNCQTAVIYENDAPVASVRTCTLAHGLRQRSPASDTFPDEVARLLAEQPMTAVGRGRGIETTRLVRSPAAADNQALVFLLYRIAGYIGMMAYTQILFACVRKNHVPFYRRLGYESVTEPRVYPGLSCSMQLLSCTRRQYDEVRQAFPVIDPFAGTTGPLDEFLSGASVELALRAF